MRNSLANTNAKNMVVTVKSLSTDPRYVQRFREVIGERAPQFLASVVSAVNGNPMLMKAEPNSVMASAMVAATLDLDVVPGLGFAALVPYNNNKKDPRTGEWSKKTECQFQIMTKGLVQLALRSGQYRNINAGPIYEDEYDGEDIITGEVRFHEVSGGQRDHDDIDHIAGYFAYIELINGFSKTEFWSMKKILAHAKRFSKTYDPKTDSFRKGTPWAENFQAMARKTVLKNALSSWGILSTQMKAAIKADQAVFKDLDKEPEYEDSPEAMPEAEQVSEGMNPETGEITAPEPAPTPAPQPEKKPRARRSTASRQTAQTAKPAPAPQPELQVQEEEIPTVDDFDDDPLPGEEEGDPMDGFGF